MAKRNDGIMALIYAKLYLCIARSTQRATDMAGVEAMAQAAEMGLEAEALKLEAIRLAEATTMSAADALWYAIDRRRKQGDGAAEKNDKEDTSMSDIKVTQEQIDLLLNSADVKVDTVDTVSGRYIIVTAKLQNGFEIKAASMSEDPKLGREICFEQIEAQLRKLESYALTKKLHEEKTAAATAAGETAVTDFGWAIRKLRCGRKLRRRGWNGKGIFIALQEPDAHSKMTSPYIYIDTTGLQTSNTEAPRSCVPWLASQTDMLAEDWEIVT